MYIEKIELKNFRNYEDLKLDFNKNVNIFLGKNAQGKTNLLEAIYISSMGKSFRTNKDNEMIFFGQDFGRIKVFAQKDNMDKTIEIVISDNSKKFAKVDGVKIKKASELLENIYIVIFSPEDLKIVKDEPEKRRKFIDRELCQLRPLYYENLSNFKKVLTQRNAYLKEMYIESSILDIWDMQLSKYGAAITLMRKDFVEKINLISKKLHYNITNGLEDLEIIYRPNLNIASSNKNQEEEYYKIIKSSYDNDIKQRTTTKGPHKDDLDFIINGINARSFGSQGQQRTAALSLKLAELDLIKKETEEDGILLLDDVMSELDMERQEYLIKTLSNIQMFITTTELPEKLKETLPEGNTYVVSNGKIIRN